MVDAARDVRSMNAARVAFHASNSEAADWAERQADRLLPAPKPEDRREAWRASLEALGIKVEE